MTTKTQAKAAIRLVLVIADVIRELKEVPSGHLYARLMDRMTLSDYNVIIGVLKSSGAVIESGHVLKWVGPPQQ